MNIMAKWLFALFKILKILYFQSQSQGHYKCFLKTPNKPLREQQTGTEITLRHMVKNWRLYSKEVLFHKVTHHENTRESELEQLLVLPYSHLLGTPLPYKVLWVNK